MNEGDMSSFKRIVKESCRSSVPMITIELNEGPNNVYPPTIRRVFKMFGLDKCRLTKKNWYLLKKIERKRLASARNHRNWTAED